MEIIDNYFNPSARRARALMSTRNKYRFWRQNRSKYLYWLHCRHVDAQYVDLWDHYILKNMVPGQTVVYDSAALYWPRLADNVTVIENSAPKLINQYVTVHNKEIENTLKNSVNNLIMFRPLSFKLTSSLYDCFAKDMPITRSGHKPKLIDWLASGAKVFLSIPQEFFAFNRFKKTLPEFIAEENQRLENDFGLKNIFLVYSKTFDGVNGSIKLVYQKS